MQTRQAIADRRAGVAVFSFGDVDFVYEPYPIGLAKGVLAEDYYARLVDNWPPRHLFDFKPAQGNKYALSEGHNAKAYHDFVRSCGPWREFYRAVKSRAFVQQVLDLLARRHIDLGVRGRVVRGEGRRSGWSEWARALRGELRRLVARQGPLSARFEFSMLPADGGCVRPHTDAPRKIVTLVLSVVRPGEWNPDFGGGTAMLRAKDVTRAYNHVNRKLGFDEVEVIKTFPFEPNQCLIFVKTFNSLHSVQPMTGTGSDAMRKTVTINIST